MILTLLFNGYPKQINLLLIYASVSLNPIYIICEFCKNPKLQILHHFELQIKVLITGSIFQCWSLCPLQVETG